MQTEQVTLPLPLAEGVRARDALALAGVGGVSACSALVAGALPAPEEVPGAQRSQMLCPARAVKVPGEHGVCSVEPVAAK